MLRRLGIRGKVLAALSVPVLVLFVLAGVVSLGSIQRAATAREMTSVLGTMQESREVVLALQAERRAALDFVALTPEQQAVADDSGVTAGEKATADLESARSATTDAIAAFDRASGDVNYGVLDPAVEASVVATRAELETLTDIRGRTDARSVGVEPILTDYADLIDRIVVLPVQVSGALDDRDLAAVLVAHADVTDVVENYRVEQAFGAQVLAGARSQVEILSLGALFPASDNAHDAAEDTVLALGLDDDVVVPPLGASFRNSQSYPSYRILVSTGEAQNLDFIEPADWTARAGEEIEALDPVQSELRQAAADRASATAGAALREALLTAAAALAAVVLSVVVAFAIARQIVNPLRRLTEAAGIVRDELPRLVDQVAIPGQGPDISLTAIPVDSQDEVGQLATAFNEVNATTIQVAQEQAALRGSIAEMFVNVARRDQVLLNRQLSFIDALERSEEDPKTLADLFRLDHLATRMRRNAESLLVLAGIDTGRRLREALPTSDVIRTASSEIEHYERIQLDLPIDPMMLGHTALPAAHMLAEILENATVFSDPGTPVHVSTGVDDDHVLITVLDQGLGMTPEELADAQSKIEATSAGDVLGSQRLGMFVVGRIAARLGARVELARGPDGTGTLVTVRMPRVLFVDAASIPFTPPTQAAARVETFVLPEEAAEVVHDTLYAPVPEHVQDVAPGSLGSEQNPAEAVDLAALTDGTTPLGLPRRRSVSADNEAPAPSTYDRDAEDAAAAPSIPLAHGADAFAGVVGLEGEEVWTPPVIEASTPLSARRAAPAPAAPPAAPVVPEPPVVVPPVQESGSALPTRQPAAPLPVREPSASSAALPTRQTAAPVPLAPATSSNAAPAEPEGRAAMFSGFRSRRAELAAAAVRVESGDDHHSSDAEPVESGDGAERLAAAAAFFGRSAPRDAAPAEDEPADATPAFVIPSLVEDDDEYGDPVFAPGAPAAVVVDPAMDEPVHEAEDTGEWSQDAPAYAPTASDTSSDDSSDEDEMPYFGRHAYVPEDLGEPTWSPQPAEPAEPAWAGHDAEPVQAVAFGHDVDGQQDQVVEVGQASMPWPPPAAEAAPAEAEASPWEQPAEPTWPPPAAEATWAPPVEPAWESSAAWPPAPEAASPEPVHPAADVAAPVASADETAVFAAPVVADAPAPAWGPVTPSEQVPEAQVAPAPAPAAAPSAEKKPKRRGWFGRKRREAEPEPVVEAPPAEPTAGFPSIATGFSSVTPMRQSAWGSSEGSHAQAVEPSAPVVPAAEAPTFAAGPVPPAEAEVPSPWQPSQAPAPAAPVAQAPAWSPQAAWEPPPMSGVTLPETTGEWAPTPAWGAESPVAPAMPQRAQAPVPPPVVDVPRPAMPAHASFSPQTTFTPEPAGTGAFDDQVTNALVHNADIASQALAELSQLSSYRPKTVSAASPTTLQRRTPGTIPAAPEIELPKSGQRVDRDANQVRSLLSSFQSGTSRGREASDGAVPGRPAPQSSGGVTDPAGYEDGSGVGHGEPVTTPDTDQNPRDTSW